MGWGQALKDHKMMDHRLLQLYYKLGLMYASLLGPTLPTYMREINLMLCYMTLILAQYADLRDSSILVVLLLQFFLYD